ncbi:MAG TPA: adenylate/guanylate cyclase domain-containing protein [Acidimicrobiales bacterium]
MTLTRAVQRVRWSVRLRLLFANLAGGLAVMTIIFLSSGRLAPELPVALEVLTWFVPMLGLFVAAYAWGHRSFTRSVQWALEERPPTEAERGEMLRQPWRQALGPLVFWLVGAALYAALSALGGAEADLVIAVVEASVLGGLTTSALSYLLIERSFRPLLVHVLDQVPSRHGRPRTMGIRMRLFVGWAAGSGIPLLAIAVDVTFGGQDLTRPALACVAFAGLAAGLLATLTSAWSLAEPLDNVRDALARVRDDDLSVGLVVDDGGEVGEVQAGFNQMVEGLRERRQLRDLFGRHVGQEVAAQALAKGTGLGGEQAEASIVFVDLVGSTAMAEVLPPDEVVDTLNDFFGVVVRTVDGQGGWVNKFEGDGALCVFGVPATQPDHPERALRAARLLHQAIGALRARHPGLEAGIGVSSGQVVAGNVGTEARYEYTVIGPAVNEAARLTEVAKGRRTKVLASGAVVRRGGREARRWRDVGTVGLRGQRAPTPIYEPVVPDRAARD